MSTRRRIRTPVKRPTTSQRNITYLRRTNPQTRTEQDAKTFLKKLKKMHSQESVHVTEDGKIFSISKDSKITVIGKDGKDIRTFTAKSSYAENVKAYFVISEDGKVKPRDYKILKLIKGEGGKTNPRPGRYDKIEGTVFTAEAMPSEGYDFSHWALPGNLAKRDNPVSFTIETNGWIKPVFRKRTS